MFITDKTPIPRKYQNPMFIWYLFNKCGWLGRPVAALLLHCIICTAWCVMRHCCYTVLYARPDASCVTAVTLCYMHGLMRHASLLLHCVICMAWCVMRHCCYTVICTAWCVMHHCCYTILYAWPDASCITAVTLLYLKLENYSS